MNETEAMTDREVYAVLKQVSNLLGGIRWSRGSDRQYEAYQFMHSCGTVDEGISIAMAQFENEAGEFEDEGESDGPAA
jgi:hypothetical protein